MYNKRLFSPDICIDYYLCHPKCSYYYNNQYIFKKRIYNDKAYYTGSETADYTYQFHKTLLQMFPCVNNNSISIAADRTDSLFAFLNAEPVRVHAHHFLAVLFLLSEGVDLPIRLVENPDWPEEKTIVHWAETVDVCFLNLRLSIPLYNSRTKQTEQIVQTEALEILKFFFYGRKKVQPEPKTMEELKKGTFLDTPQFLIQTYIFEFLETVEEAKKFSESVYIMLVDLALAQDNGLSNNSPEAQLLHSLIRRCFIEHYPLIRSTSHIQKLRTIETLLEKPILFPFSGSSQLPSYRRLSWCSDYFELFNSQKHLLSPLEATLFIVFCCAAYDPMSEKYSMKDAKYASSKLTAFFEKHCRPLKQIDAEIIKDWKDVFSDAKSHYKTPENLNSVDFGIFNFLFAIASITNNPEIHQTVIQKMEILREMYFSNANRTAYTSFFIQESQHIKIILDNLVGCGQVTVVCKIRDIYPEKTAPNIIELYGTISIIYRNNYIMPKNTAFGVFITFSRKSTDVYMLNDEVALLDREIVELQKIKAEISNSEAFIDYLLAYYIENIIANNTNKSRELGVVSIKDRIRKIIQKTPENINAILLLNKMQSVEYRRLVMAYSLCYAQKEKVQLGYESPLRRFTSNILGSLPLSAKRMRNWFVSTILYLKIDKNIYPTIRFTPDKECLNKQYMLTDCKNIDYLLDTEFISFLVYALEEYGLVRNLTDPHCVLRNPEGIEYIFDWLFEQNTMQRASYIFFPYFKIHANVFEAKVINRVFFVWFILACKNKKKHPDLIYKLYNYIKYNPFEQKLDFSCIERSDLSRTDFNLLYKRNSAKVIQAMNQLETQLKIEKSKYNDQKFSSICSFFEGIPRNLTHSE